VASNGLPESGPPFTYNVSTLKLLHKADMRYQDWLNEANSKTNEALVSCFNNQHLGGWSENHITTKVMESIESLGLEIDWTDKAQKVQWEGFKLKGTPETSFGDIAVIVKVWVTSDRFVEGVAFYEAKRQFFDNKWSPKGFASIKQEQLANIISKTHASNVLLYDVDLEGKTAWASAVPTALVDELARAKLASNTGRVLHHYGDLWVKSLGNNLLGMHLDFRKESVDEIKNLLHGAGRPLIIINAAVAKMKILEPKIDNSFINKNLYERLTTPNEPERDVKTEPRNDDLGEPRM